GQCLGGHGAHALSHKGHLGGVSRGERHLHAREIVVEGTDGLARVALGNGREVQPRRAGGFSGGEGRQPPRLLHQGFLGLVGGLEAVVGGGGEAFLAVGGGLQGAAGLGEGGHAGGVGVGGVAVGVEAQGGGQGFLKAAVAGALHLGVGKGGGAGGQQGAGVHGGARFTGQGRAVGAELRKERREGLGGEAGGGLLHGGAHQVERHLLALDHQGAGVHLGQLHLRRGVQPRGQHRRGQ